MVLDFFKSRADIMISLLDKTFKFETDEIRKSYLRKISSDIDKAEKELGKLLEDPRRLKILGFAQYFGKVNYYQISKILDIGYNAVIKHVEKLIEFELVEVKKSKLDGRGVNNIMIPKHVQVILEFEELNQMTKDQNWKKTKERLIDASQEFEQSYKKEEDRFKDGKA